MKYIFTWVIFLIFTVQLNANQAYNKEEIIQRIGKYRTLPDHKAIVAAIDSREHRAIGFSVKQANTKSAKDNAYQECIVEKKKKQIHTSCKLLALDDAVGCKEIKEFLHKQFALARKKAQKIEHINHCLRKNSKTLVEQCAKENHLGNKLLALWENEVKREEIIKKFDNLIETNRQVDQKIQNEIDTMECSEYSF